MRKNSTIKVQNNTSTAVSFNPGGKTFYDLKICGTGSYSTTISGANIFNQIIVDATEAPKIVRFTVSTTQTAASFLTIGQNTITMTNTSSSILKPIIK